VEVHGVGAQDEHLIPTFKIWIDQKMNLVIQQFLRNYVPTNQQDWVDHLELPEFCYNNLEHLATGAFSNRSHPLSNGDGRVTNCAQLGQHMGNP
jgi:hypothetical protein